jgi:hypothetical protein
LAALLAALAVIGGRVPAVSAGAQAPVPIPGPIPAGWQAAPVYLALLTPRLHRDDYTVYTSPAGLDQALAQLGGLPALLHPPGAWRPLAASPADAFGEAAEYNRWNIARLYGATRARVARGPAGQDGRVTEAWTLISPYPEPALERLHDGTLLIVLRIRDR